MLILPEKNAIFYHVYKVAGSSIRNALLPYAKRSQVAGQYINHMLLVARLPHSSDPLLNYHPKLVDVKKKLGSSFYSYYRFAFVRNPMDWQKSLYYFMLKKQHLPGNKRIASMSFDEYLTWRMDNELRFQTDFLYDGDEKLIDDIFHFETINEDFATLAGKIGIEASLPHLNKAGSGKTVDLSEPVLDRFMTLHAAEYDRLGYPRTRRV
ncbi:sulfotransferase family 2 domain-containing protein [Jiella avicenniae]|uniref:Sulfotransferase family protein n=1 Tax=Jiella avicenniae TaxID=2907202 RepID=A0A9X1P5F1_9HYPH|nr:sulfotransferase family 2 domain-containing protein [Jiella avicenniae]MCE7030848.1 sulfotransferase family protein [Jiella avicenniae]